MWPFRKSDHAPALARRLGDDVVARYNAELHVWSFRHKGVEFSVSSSQLRDDTLIRADESLAIVRSLDRDLRKKVEEELADWPCDKSKTHVALIDLGDFVTPELIEVTLVGDESWGDLAVDVVVKEGEITDVIVGD